MQKISLMLVEDDTNASIWILRYFESLSFDVDCFETISDAISHLNQKHYDIVLLDLNLPDFHGYEMLKHINKNPKNIPVIVLSAYWEKETIIQAFKFGASDYMKKPIDIEELEARIWVHLKNSATPSFEEKKKQSCFEHKKQKIYFANTPLPFTKVEKLIVTVLIQNKNAIVKRQTLWQELSAISSQRSLDYHIGNIRKKLSMHTQKDDMLQTIYGVGYKLMCKEN